MNHKNKELLLKLVTASNETEVEAILENDAYAKSLGWWPFNGKESNLIKNHQSIDWWYELIFSHRTKLACTALLGLLQSHTFGFLYSSR